MFRKRLFWIIVLALVLAASGGGYYYYDSIYLQAQEPLTINLIMTYWQAGIGVQP